MDYNRVVKDLNDLTEETFLKKLEDNYHLSTVTFKEAKPAQLHQFGMYLNQQWYSLTAKPHIIKTDPIGMLDVSILSETVLNRCLALKTSEQINVSTLLAAYAAWTNCNAE